MNDLHLRALTVEDWTLLRQMRLRMITMHPDIFYDTVEAATSRPPSYWQARLMRPGSKSFCLFDGDRCVGVSSVLDWAKDETGRTGMNCSTFLEPDYRGKGLVDLFYEARIKHAIAYKPWRKIITDHRIGNEASRRAMLKHGFVFTEKVMVDWPNGDQDYELRYKLVLENLRQAQ